VVRDERLIIAVRGFSGPGDSSEVQIGWCAENKGSDVQDLQMRLVFLEVLVFTASSAHVLFFARDLWDLIKLASNPPQDCGKLSLLGILVVIAIV